MLAPPRTEIAHGRHAPLGAEFHAVDDRIRHQRRARVLGLADGVGAALYCAPIGQTGAQVLLPPQAGPAATGAAVADDGVGGKAQGKACLPLAR